MKQKLLNKKDVYTRTDTKALKTKKSAFTLAEVLIVIGIIGIVAALLIPSLIKNFNERTNSYKEANIAQKITQGIELMNAAGDFNNFDTTEEFVDALSKHMKIAQICTSDNLQNCWSSKVIKNSSNDNYEVKNAKTGLDLHTGNITNLAGLILADGSQIILTYDPSVGSKAIENITPVKKTLPVGFGKTKEFAYTTSITSGIDFVMDVNGTAGPNAETTETGEYNDIRSFRIASFSQAGCQGENVGGTCIYQLRNNFIPISCVDGNNEEYCDGNTTSTLSFYAGAKKACAEMGMKLASTSELQTIVSLGIIPLETNTRYYYVNGVNNGQRCGASVTYYGCAGYFGDNRDTYAVCIR